MVANAGIDQDNSSYCNLTSAHDDHNQKVTGTNLAVDSGINIEDSSNNTLTKLSDMDDEDYGNGAAGSQFFKGVAPVVESKGEADRGRNGTAKSSMQRRGSKGRKKKLPGQNLHLYCLFQRKLHLLQQLFSPTLKYLWILKRIVHLLRTPILVKRN